jgi:hypothetical protein
MNSLAAMPGDNVTIMFERTVSLWRRLTGRPGLAGAPMAAVGEERRLWVRYPTDVPTYYQAANGRSEEGRLSARIRDISLAGIQLTVDRAFEPGSLLTVELPAVREGERRTVLACVVHVRAVGDKEWAIGCSFARELGDDDLAAFRASRTKAAPGDNRYWERFACNVKAVCQVVSPTDPERWSATVLNISASGMALQVDRDVPTGALLAVELQGGSSKTGTTILACVVHVLTQTSGERVLGCNFIRELSDTDLAALV